MQNMDLLDELIVGRVEPNIYAFSTNTVPNYLKVGDTYRPVAVRLNEWKKYFPNLVEEYHDSAAINNDLFFRDFAVHQYLENDLGKHRLQPDQIEDGVYYSKEFFEEASVGDVTDAISDIKTSYSNNADKYQYYSTETHLPEVYTYASTGLWKARPNQKAAVDAFDKAVKAGRTNLLMYAVMRFGKSFTSMLCAQKMKARLVLIVSAKADVREEWKKTVQSADNFNKDYSFLDNRDLADNGCFESEFSNGKSVVVFLTLQDLQGDEIKEKHRQIFSNKVDLLIIDETHYGARAEKYGQVLKGSKHKKDGEDYIDVDEAEEQLKVLNARIRLHLSGTPYRILMGSEFSKEDIIAFCQFTDIVQAQSDWDAEHILSDDVKEWDNPYYGFPQMIRFAFYPNESAKQKLNQLKQDGQTYAFSALLRPKSIDKDDNDQHKQFIHEQEVVDLLQAIDGSKQDKNVLSFLDYDKIKDGSMCRHMVIVLPFCASCDAMEELIISNADKFKNLSHYKIINISGVNAPSKYRNVQDVKRIIREHETDNEKTITLTVNRMLTGSTVEEWDTMIYLKDTASPQEYDQAIFRLQNQYVRTMTDDNGDVIKFNMKPQTLLVDFDPHRMFVMQEQKSLIYNVNVEKGGNSKLKERIESELAISPIITLNKEKIERVEPTDILAAVSEYSISRGVMDETRDIPVDFSLLDIEAIRAVIEVQAEIGSNKGFDTEATRGEGESSDVDVPDGDGSGLEDDEGGTDKGTRGSDGNEEPDETDDAKVMENKFRTYYSRILFFAFLTKDRVSSLENVLSVISNGDNIRIAKNLKLEKADLTILLRNMNAFILSQLDYKIQNINNLANDEEVEPIQRALTAIRKFERLSASEVATPKEITDTMVQCLPRQAFDELSREGHAILDLGSKAGEFAIAITEYCNSIGIETNTIKSRILSIPTSSVAYEFTRKIYEVLGLEVSCIAEKFDAYDLLSIKDDGKVDYERIAEIVMQKKFLQSISLENKRTGGEKMKFEAIVGNPPYDKKGISTRSQPIYNDFYEMAFRMSDLVTLITPARFLFDAGYTPSAWNNKMLSDKHFKVIKYYEDSRSVFSTVELKGGVAVTLRDASKNYGEIGTYSPYNEMVGVIKKISKKTQGTQKLDSIIASQGLYKFSDDFFDDHPEAFQFIGRGTRNKIVSSIMNKLPNVFKDTLPEKGGYIKLLGRVNGGREYKYILRKYIIENEYTDKYKLFIPEANNSGRFGETLTEPTYGYPGEGTADTFLCGGLFDSEVEMINFSKYMKTKLFRALLGVRKVTQHCPPGVWKTIPLQDFSSNSDIDWTETIDNVDKQLYRKYDLSEDEIAFIETKVDKMD